MSGAMRKIGEYLGLLEDTGRYDDEYDEHEHAEDEPAVVATPRRRCPRGRARRPWPTSPSAAVRRPGRRRRVGRRAVPDHHAAPAHLQRGAHRRRELPRRHAR